MADFASVATLDEVPDCTMKQVVVNGELVGLYRVGDAVYAVSDVCSHEEAYLTEGDFECEDLEVECPRHGSRFNIATGEVRILPATKPIDTYEVKIEGNLILVGPKRKRSE